MKLGLSPLILMLLVKGVIASDDIGISGCNNAQGMVSVMVEYKHSLGDKVPNYLRLELYGDQMPNKAKATYTRQVEIDRYRNNSFTEDFDFSEILQNGFKTAKASLLHFNSESKDLKVIKSSGSFNCTQNYY